MEEHARAIAERESAEVSAHLNALAAIESEALADCLGIRLRSFVTPDGVDDHLIRKHNIPVTGGAFQPQTVV